MLGSACEAEDVVGDVALRWMSAQRADVDVPEAWLVTATTRRALDVLRSARLRRQHYPGVWLPEPVVTGDGPGDALERVETLTMGFLLLLERLTPIERAVMVLHDALEYPYATVAAATGRSEAACRQALHRAREHVSVPQRRSAVDREHARVVAERFVAAGLSGDVTSLMECLSPDIVVTSDGGGLVHAAMRPVTGSQRVGRYLHNLMARLGDDPFVLPCEINGEPGALAHTATGWVAHAVGVEGDLVVAMYVVVSPPKLERLVRSFPSAAGRPGPWTTASEFRHRGGRAVG